MEMTHGNLWKKIFVFSFPLMFTNLMQLLFNMADVAIVGKFAGSLSLGAVGSTTLLISLTTGWMIGIANGVNSVTAFFVGANTPDREHKAVQTGFLICLAFGIFTLLLGFTLASPVLRLLHTKSELIDEATLYFRIYMFGSPALAIFNFGNSVLSAEGDTRKPLVYLFAAGIINVFLNLFFVLVFHMTSDGVAYASIISQYISAFLILRALITLKTSGRLDLWHPSFDRSIAAHILRIGIPAALQSTLFAVANLFIQSAVNSFDHVVVEGNSAAMNIDNLVYQMMAAFYAASTSFIAQNYGAGEKDRVSKTYLITTIYSFSLAFILGIFIYFFRGSLLYLFTNDAKVVAAGSIRLEMLAFAYCLSAFMDNATAACRGLGKTLVPTIILMLGTIVFRITWLYTIFAYFHTLQSLYLLYACAFVLTSIALNICFFRIYHKVFSAPHTFDPS